MSLPVDKALRKAQSHIKAGQLAKAEELYKQVLVKFPKNKKASEGYQKLRAGITSKGLSGSEPPKEKVQELMSLYNHGQLDEVLSKAKPLISLFPKVIVLHNLVAAANSGLKNFDQAIESFHNVLALNPKDAMAYFNIGTVFLERKGFVSAIENYHKCLAINPNHAEAHDNIGSALKAQGNLTLAIEQFTQAINLKPNFAQAHYNLGVVLQETGNLQGAIKSYRKACKIKPDYAEAFNNIGNVLKDKGEQDAALDSYKQAIMIKPDYADAYYNKGNALQDKGELDAAIGSYKQAIMIKPDYADAYYNMGNAFKDKGEIDVAIDSYKHAIKINPDYADAYSNMGVALNGKGELDAAIDSYKHAIKINPDYADAYSNMGLTLNDKGELDAAIDSYKQAIKIKPKYAEAHYNMGITLKDKGDLNAAIASYKQAIKIKPDYAEAYNNLGIVLGNRGDPSSAIENYKYAIKVNPNFAEAYLNMGNSLKDLGELNAALKIFQKAIEIKPDYVEAILNQSLAYLHKGDFKNGWAQYEWRLKREKRENISLKSTKPRWHSFEAGNVLLWAEQGIGDEIMFASVIPDLYANCSKLSVQIDKRLIKLFKRSFPEDIVFWPSDKIVPETEYDAHIPIGSLPQYYRQSIDSFRPTAKGWLNASAKRARSLREQLLTDGTETLIGISWHSTKPRSGAEKKIIPLNKLVKKLHNPGVKLVNLQYGDVNSELGKLQKEFGIEVIQIPDIDNKDDIDDLAALIMACDKIVSISNVTAHLAGALGKEAQVLLPFSCDWRWGKAGNSSNWYSSVCLYRQTRLDDWDSALINL